VSAFSISMSVGSTRTIPSPKLTTGDLLAFSLAAQGGGGPGDRRVQVDVVEVVFDAQVFEHGAGTKGVRAGGVSVNDNGMVGVALDKLMADRQIIAVVMGG
jgi:hypothetical protein